MLQTTSQPEGPPNSRQAGGWTVDIAADSASLDRELASLRTSADGREVRLRLSAASGLWPSEHQVRELASCGVALLEVVEDVHLSADAAHESLDFLRFLRDSMSHSLRVRWTGRFGAGVPIRAISHLTPPAGAGLALNPAVAAWRQQFSLGRFYWRKGPGFILVRDSRLGRRSAGWTISDPIVVETFAQLMQPTSMASYAQRPSASRCVEELLEHETIVQLGDMLLTLPYRMRHWPIMYNRQADGPASNVPARPEDAPPRSAPGDSHV